MDVLKEYFNLKEVPFRIEPVPDIFYPSTTHSGAWEFLVQSLSSEVMIVAVLGEYGTGKTLLCQRLCHYLETKSRHKYICIEGSLWDFSRFLRKIITLINKGAESPFDEYTLMDLLDRGFENASWPVFLIIDDAQYIPPQDLCRLKGLLDISFKGRFPFRCILFAHDSLEDRLKKDESLLPIKGRIGRVYRISPLSFTEAREYIYFRLFKSGGSGRPVFAEETLHYIFTLSKGVPRDINRICDTALAIAANEKKDIIDLSIAKEATSWTLVEDVEMALSGAIEASAPTEPSPDDENRSPSKTPSADVAADREEAVRESESDSADDDLGEGEKKLRKMIINPWVVAMITGLGLILGIGIGLLLALWLA